MLPKSTPLLERFWSRVDKNGPVPTHCPEFGPCWLWTGEPMNHGYGQILTEGGRSGRKLLAHRLAWGLASGEMPPADRVVMHACDTKLCTRNDEPGTYAVNGVVLPRWGHLVLGTLGLNGNDARAKGRTATGDKNGSRTHPEQYPKGERIWSAVLTDALVRALRLRYDQAPDQRGLIRLLARECGVSRQTMAKALHRHTFRHVR